MVSEIVAAVLFGALQGVLEWLPISSEGNVAVVVSALTGATPIAAVQLSLFLHAGTGLAAALYYREDIVALLHPVPPVREFVSSTDSSRPELAFLVLATLASGVVGLLVYGVLEALLSGAAIGGLVVLVGVLLIITGLIQRSSTLSGFSQRETPRVFDAVLVGAGQGLALLPGVSRSGTTTSLLLLRGFDETAAFRLSFLLAIPASGAAAVLSIVETGGVPSLGLTAAALGFLTSLVVGYASIDVLLRVVERIAFWLVCLVFGGLMLAGGVFLL